jgi:DNA replication protein DnaC
MKATASLLPDHLAFLKLPFFLDQHRPLADQAAREHWAHGDFLARLADGEVHQRQEQSLLRRVKQARFPWVKSLDQYQWSWPKKVNRVQIQHLFSLGFLETHTNVVFCGSVGLGKTHLAIALAHAACVAGHSVLFCPAVDVINNLAAAQASHRLKSELKKYVAPRVLVLDEVGYLPIDKTGADLLFQVLSARYERASTLLTTNKAYKHWASIFNNDPVLTSAMLDRLLHHAETIVIEGPSYRMKDRVEDPA